MLQGQEQGQGQGQKQGQGQGRRKCLVIPLSAQRRRRQRPALGKKAALIRGMRELQLEQEGQQEQQCWHGQQRQH